MLMLTIALQVLTLMEFVSRRGLSKSGESISGLVPGNPKFRLRQIGRGQRSYFKNKSLSLTYNP
jgi:hypothetical protein